MASDRLYELAFQFKNCRLWDVIADTELYAVQFQDGEIGYCSVMGMLRQHLAIGVYIGQSGYASCRYTLDLASPYGDIDEMEAITAQECLQCSFENKEMLSEEELGAVRDYCRRSDKKLRGRNAFPQFLKYVPGRYPWPLGSEEEESRLIQALEASVWLRKTLNSRDKQSLGLNPVSDNTLKIPLLMKINEKWKLGYTILPNPEQIWPAPVLENEVLTARIRKLKKKGTWESGSFYLPEPARSEDDEEPAPYFPLILLNVDRKTGMVMIPIIGAAGQEEKMLLDLAERMVSENDCPAKILVGDARTEALLKDFCARTGVQLRYEGNLRAFEEAKASLNAQFLGDGDWDMGDPDEPEEDNSFGEENTEDLDQFLNALMLMRDEELQTMPKDLVKIIYQMAEWGMVPDALLRKMKKIFG